MVTNWDLGIIQEGTGEPLCIFVTCRKDREGDSSARFFVALNSKLNHNFKTLCAKREEVRIKEMVVDLARIGWSTP